MLVPTAVAVGADWRDLAVILEEGERYLPSLAVLLIHGPVVGAKGKPRQRSGARRLERYLN